VARPDGHALCVDDDNDMGRTLNLGLAFGDNRRVVDPSGWHSVTIEGVVDPSGWHSVTIEGVVDPSGWHSVTIEGVVDPSWGSAHSGRGPRTVRVCGPFWFRSADGGIATGHARTQGAKPPIKCGVHRARGRYPEGGTACEGGGAQVRAGIATTRRSAGDRDRCCLPKRPEGARGRPAQGSIRRAGGAPSTTARESSSPDQRLVQLRSRSIAAQPRLGFDCCNQLLAGTVRGGSTKG